MTRADKQDRTQVRCTAKAVQRATVRSLERAYVDYGSTVEKARDDADATASRCTGLICRSRS